MRTFLRPLSIFLVSCIVGCEKRPVVGELVAVVRPAGIETPVFIEPDGDSTLTILRSEKFWQERIVPRLNNQTPAIRSFLDARKTHFVAIYTGKYTIDKASRYLGTFELSFRNLTRADAAIMFSVIIAAYEEQAAAKYYDALPDLIAYLEERLQNMKKPIETLPPNSLGEQNTLMWVAALEKKLTEIPAEKPPVQIISSRILD